MHRAFDTVSRTASRLPPAAAGRIGRHPVYGTSLALVLHAILNGGRPHRPGSGRPELMIARRQSGPRADCRKWRGSTSDGPLCLTLPGVVAREVSEGPATVPPRTTR